MSSPWLKEDGEPRPGMVITAKLDPPAAGRCLAPLRRDRQGVRGGWLQGLAMRPSWG